MKRPSMDDTLMGVAFLMAQRGTCSRAQVGAVAALDTRILSTGYNGVPAGMPHCQHPPEEENYGLIVGAPSAPGVHITVHAEGNLIAFAARRGIGLDGSTVYTTLSPCAYCAGLLINAGVVRVVVAAAYRDQTGVELLRDATIDVIQWGNDEQSAERDTPLRQQHGRGSSFSYLARPAPPSSSS